MNYAFLDVDGVLNSTRSCLALGGYGFFPGRGRLKLVENWVEDTKLDPIALKLFRRLVVETKAAVVISSTWRLGSTVDDFKRLFEAYNVGDIEVVGLTTDSRKGFRGDEVNAYIVDHFENDDNYVILDDDTDFYPHQDAHFVHINRDYGFSYEDFEQAKLILSWEYPFNGTSKT